MRRVMMMTLLSGAVALCACSDDPVTVPGPSTPRDASVVADAGHEAPDDAGEVVADSGATEIDAGDTTPDGGADAGTTPDAGTAMACMPAEVPCQDESIQELSLFRMPNNAMVTHTATTGGTITQVDTTGGGLTPTRSYVYLKFGATGLDRVDIGDEAALDSMDWDISMRRFVVRLNSGVSGPSCVGARRTAPGTRFDDVTTVPAGDARYEEYMTPAPNCALVNDGSGLPGSPGVALQSFWEYPGCVKMTGNVYVLSLADGRAVKLQVLSYYTLANQQLCDTQSRIMTPSGAGALRFKWAFL